MPLKRKKSAERSVRVNRTISSAESTSHKQLPPLKVPAPFQGFIDFIREQGVVGIGVGFIIGSSANTLVHSVVTNLLNPVIGLLTGGINLTEKVVCLKSAKGVCKDPFNYGTVISDLMTFLIILLVVYMVIKSLRLDKLDKKKD
jgi:large conductance mechanosensitive channel